MMVTTMRPVLQTAFKRISLSSEQYHFDLTPTFTHFVGWGRATRDFEGRQSGLVVRVNEAVPVWVVVGCGWGSFLLSRAFAGGGKVV